MADGSAIPSDPKHLITRRIDEYSKIWGYMEFQGHDSRGRHLKENPSCTFGLGTSLLEVHLTLPGKHSYQGDGRLGV